jgi:hypothetical protein
MKTGILPIASFEALDKIAEEYGVDDKEWAKLAFGSEKSQTRLSELRRKARVYKEGGEDATGRAFTVAKCYSLLSALREIIGGEKLAKALKKLLKESKTPREKALILLMAASDKDILQIEAFLKLVVGIKE